MTDTVVPDQLGESPLRETGFGTQIIELAGHLGVGQLRLIRGFPLRLALDGAMIGKAQRGRFECFLHGQV